MANCSLTLSYALLAFCVDSIAAFPSGVRTLVTTLNPVFASSAV